MRVIKFVHNIFIKYKIEVRPRSTKSFKDGAQCSNREAIAGYLFPLLCLSKFKHIWHVQINGTKKNKDYIRCVLKHELHKAEDAVTRLEDGLELLRRLR